MSLLDDIHQIALALTDGAAALKDGVASLKVIAADVHRVVAEFTGEAVDLDIVFESTAPPTPKKDGAIMSNKKATGPAIQCPCLVPKGGKKAVMPDVTLTSPLPASIMLQPLDASGNPVVLTPSDTVTGTLTSDNAGLTITAGADTTHYTGTIPANTPMGTVANLAATLTGTIQGAAANLTASVKVTINVPPSPVAVDLAIVFGS